jgi:SAM-dependent methyltransferase
MGNWDVLAELDPLWTILSDPTKKFGKWDSKEFFGTGAKEAERVLALCRSHSLDISFGKLLDFGCGVGRMTRGFSHFFSSCTGIDVSSKMVGLAKQFNADVSKCDFVVSDRPELPFESNSFDFVFSLLVLQHLPTKTMIRGFIAEFIRVAKDGGVIVFQLPNEVPLRRRIQLRRRLWSLLSAVGVPQSWLFKTAGLAPIQMNGISKDQVESCISSHGARVQAAERYDLAEDEYHSYYYIVQKPAKVQA